MSAEILMNQIYNANMWTNRSRQTCRIFVDQIGEVLKNRKGSKKPKPASIYKKSVMNIKDTREFFKDKSKWRSIVSAYSEGQKA